MTPSELVAGQIIGGKYTLRRLLEQVPNGAVYQAITAPSREVAVKVLDASVAAQPGFDSLLRESTEQTNALPATVAIPVLELGRDPGTGMAFVVSDLCVFPSLSETVRLCPLAGNELAMFARNLALALDTAHARGILHLALTPGSVFVGPAPRWEVRLADFSGVLVMRAGARFATSLQDEPPSVAADVEGAARIILHAATGGVLQDVRDATLRAAATTLANERGVTVDPRLDEPLARALSRDPASRYPSVSELAEAVASALGAPPAKSSRRMVAAAAVPPPPADLHADTERPAPIDVPAPPPELFAPAAVPMAPVAPEVFAPPPSAPVLPAPPPYEPAPVAMAMPVAVPFEVSAPSVVVPSDVPPLPTGSSGGRIALLVAAILIPLVLIGAGGALFAFRRHSAAAPVASAASAPPVVAKAEPPPASAPPAAPTPAPTPEPKAAPAAAPSADVANSAPLTVVCTPECATVKVDGELVTDYPVAIAAGSHTIVATRGVHPPQTKQVTLKAGKKETVSFVWLAPTTPKKNCGKFLKRCD